MTKTEIQKELLRYTGGSPIIRLSEVCGVVRDKNQHRVKQKYLVGLEKIGGGFFVPEVAQRLKDTAVL